MRFILSIALWGLLFATATAALLAERSWVAELITHFSLHMLLAGIFCVLLFGWQRRFLLTSIAFIVVAVNGGKVLPFFLSEKDPAPITSGTEVTIAQLNTYYKNTNYTAITQWLSANKEVLDIVLLHEVTPALSKELEKLVDAYPHQLLLPYKGTTGTALLSRYPFSKKEKVRFGKRYDYYTHAIAQIQGKELELFALHTANPVRHPFFLMARNFELAGTAAAVSGSTAKNKIMFGDFNISPYSPYFTRTLLDAGLKNAMRGFGIQNTWLPHIPVMRSLLGLAIDHTFVSKNIQVISREVGPSLGSDHFTVITKIVLEK